jgi:hypothetical protein
MAVSDKSKIKKTKFFLLYDSEGNPSEFLLGLKSIYQGANRDVYNLFQDIGFSDLPSGISSKQVWQMAHGRGRKRQINQEHYIFLKKQFFPEFLPNSIAQHSDSVTISPQFKIRALQNIRLSQRPLEDNFKEAKLIPRKLTPEKLIEILNGKDRTIPKTYYDFIKENFYEVGFDVSIRNKTILLPVTQSFKTRIKRNIRWSESNLEDHFRNDDLVPEGLTQENLINWLASDNLEFPSQYIEFIKKNWWSIFSSQSSMKPIKPEVIVVNKQVADLIINEVHRTGIPFTKALKLAEKIPKGLLPRTIRSWFQLRHKCYPVAKKEYVDFVISLYQSLPDQKKL